MTVNPPWRGGSEASLRHHPLALDGTRLGGAIAARLGDAVAARLGGSARSSFIRLFFGSAFVLRLCLGLRRAASVH